MTAAVIGTSTMFSPSCLEDLGRLAERLAVEREGGPGQRPLRPLVARLRRRVARRAARAGGRASLRCWPSRSPTRARTPAPSPRPGPPGAARRDRGVLAARAAVDPDPDRQRGVERQVAVVVAPGAVAEPGVLEADELVEVVAAPLEERAASPKPRELGAQVLAVVEPGDGVRGVPDRGVLDVGVARRAVPVDEGAVDAVAVDEERARDPRARRTL